MNPGALLAVACSAGLLIACGGDGDDSSSSTTAAAAADDTTTTEAEASPASGADGPSTVDPCSLITADDASAIIGTEVGGATSTPFESGSSCIYQSGQSLVGVQVYSAPGTEELLAANSPLFAGDSAPIDGVGEAAYFSEAEATMGVLQDGVIFSVTIAIDAQPATRDQVEAATESALANL